MAPKTVSFILITFLFVHVRHESIWGWLWTLKEFLPIITLCARFGNCTHLREESNVWSVLHYCYPRPAILLTSYAQGILLNRWSPSICSYWTAKHNLFKLQLLRLIFVSFTAFYEIDKLFSLIMNEIGIFFSQNMNQKYW